jgi:hypothetical protein
LFDRSAAWTSVDTAALTSSPDIKAALFIRSDGRA